MDAREPRGLVIAATCRLNRLSDGTWLVPSQTNRDGGAYRANLYTKTYTCPDHVEGGNTCKHYYSGFVRPQAGCSPGRDRILTSALEAGLGRQNSWKNQKLVLHFWQVEEVIIRGAPNYE